VIAKQRFVGAALIALVLAVCLAVPVGAAPRAGCKNAHRAGSWTRIDPPEAGVLGSVLHEVRSAVVLTRTPNVVLETDGDAIFRSIDGGCTWKTVYTQGVDGPDIGATTSYYITSIAVPRTLRRADGKIAYATLTGGVPLTFGGAFSVGPPVLLLASRNAGRTWNLVRSMPSPSAPAIPGCADGASLSVAPSDPRVLYLFCLGFSTVGGAVNSAAYGALQPLYRSADGGVSWGQITLPMNTTYFTPAVDPSSPKTVWIVGTPSVDGKTVLAVWKSTDAGGKWTEKVVSPKGSGEPPFTIDAIRPPHQKTHLVVSSSLGAFESTDAGATWRLRVKGLSGEASSEVVKAATFAPGGGLFVVVDAKTSCGDDQRLLMVGPRARPREVGDLSPSKWGQVQWTATVGAAGPARPVVFGVAGFRPDAGGGSCPANTPGILEWQAPRNRS